MQGDSMFASRSLLPDEAVATAFSQRPVLALWANICGELKNSVRCTGDASPADRRLTHYVISITF